MNPPGKPSSLKRFFITLGIVLLVTPLFTFLVAELFAFNPTVVVLLVMFYLIGVVLWLGISARRVGAIYVMLHIIVGILGLGLALALSALSPYNGPSVAIAVLIITILFNVILACLAPFIFSLRERVAFFHVPQQPQQPQPASQQQGQQVVYQQIVYVPYDPNSPDAPKFPSIPQMPPIPTQPQNNYQEGYRPAQPQPKEEYNHYQEGSRTYTFPTGTTQSQVSTQYPEA